jgi:ribosomal protein L37E
MANKNNAILPVLIIAGLEITGNLHEIWWKCRRCRTEYDGTHAACPSCGYLGASKILKPFTEKIGIMRFGCDDNDDFK